MLVRIWLHAFTILSMSLFFGGCSIFEVRDTFRLAGQGSGALNYKTDTVELRAEIKPDTRFFSIGLLGAPVVPIHFKISDPSEMVLAFELSLHRDYDFYFLFHSCLTIENSKPICPEKLVISVFAQFQEDGFRYSDGRRRWHRNPIFHKSENLVITPITAPENNLVSRKRIYQHYGYTGEQKWDYLRVHLKYIYRCEVACPKKVGLRIKDFAFVENHPLPSHVYTFEKTRENNYHFTVLVQ